MARETKVVPDLYFPGEDQELQASNAEGKGEQGEGGGLEGGEAVDLTPEGFIPIHTLTLGDLPEPIRTEQNLQYILDLSKNVVKVNNNGLSCRRPDDDEFKRRKQRALCGSGFLQRLYDNYAEIITNNHVLFNEEELNNSTFDVFFDYHHGDPEDKKKLSKRCARTNGKFFTGKYSKDDFAVAFFGVNHAMVARIKEHCCDLEAIQHHHQPDFQLDLTDDLKVAPIVCLISHPLGQPKHVSFGEMLDYDIQSTIIHHTAPSKPGSSGGPVIIFSKSCRFGRFSACHVGTDPRNGNKYATMHSEKYSPADVTFEKYVPCGEPEKARVSLEMVVLAAFFPVFGAFLLRAGKTRLARLDTSSLKPCKTFLTYEHLTSRDLKQSVKDVVAKLAQVAPSFTACPSSNVDKGSDLVSLLKSQGPCFCQSIVKMMERGVRSENDTVTECFLSPYTALKRMSTESDVTWPWMNRSKSDTRNEDGVEDCLMKKCRDLCDKNFILVPLLLMITKANHCVKQLFPQSCAVPTTMTSAEVKGEWEKLYRKTEQVSPCDQSLETRPVSISTFPSLRSEQKLNSSSADVEGDWGRLTGDVLSVMKYDNLVYLSAICSAMPIHNTNNQRVIPQQADTDEDLCLYSRCLALSEHAWQHELQTHPDTERVGREHSSGNCCRCGRPGVKDVTVAIEVLPEPENSERARDSQHKRTKGWDDKDFLPETRAMMGGKLLIHFLPFIRQLQDIASEKSLTPGTYILNFLENEAFPHGRHALMLFMATREALLYNLCLLLKHISKHLQPRYFAFPVSVCGRPGNWPGNVTPPEVQRTAWRLVQDAIMASGFPPAVLSALEEDADRREKLIDLYVDMKQLKWDRRIRPHLFAVYLAASKQALIDISQGRTVFRDSTHYFVWYAAFLVCPKRVFSRSYISQPHSLK